jgi:hypothetical protein
MERLILKLINPGRLDLKQHKHGGCIKENFTAEAQRRRENTSRLSILCVSVSLRLKKKRDLKVNP